MTNNNDPPPKQLFTILFFLGVLFFPIQVDKAANKPAEQQELYLRADCPVSPKNSVAMASLGSGDDLFERIIQCESGGDPLICNAECGCGCGMGLAQLIPSTVKYCEEKLGKEIDPFNAEDNLECARWLFLNEGTRHWNQSKFCWDK